jgi:solute carrier family 25 (mitochondrial thiamine pyrophosphate transporter), member 19
VYKGLFKGNWAAAYLYMAYGACQFASYSHINSYIAKEIDFNFLGNLERPLKKGLSGGTAGIIATTVTYPFDLMRTRFAAQGEKKVHFT